MIVCVKVAHIGIACERAKNSTLQSAPIVLVDTACTVMVASEETEVYGVVIGKSAKQAKALCPSLCILPYDASAYAGFAQGICSAMSGKTTRIIPVLPDEWYVALLGPDAAQEAVELGLEISEQFHIPVQIGMGHSMRAARSAAVQVGNSAARGQERKRNAPALQMSPSRRRSDFVHGAATPRETLEADTGKPGADPARPSPFHRDLTGRYISRGSSVTNTPGCAPGKASKPQVSERLDFETAVTDEPAIIAAVRVCAARLARSLETSHETCSTLSLELTTESGPTRGTIQLKAATSTEETLLAGASRLFRRLTVIGPVLGVTLTASDLQLQPLAAGA